MLMLSVENPWLLLVSVLRLGIGVGCQGAASHPPRSCAAAIRSAAGRSRRASRTECGSRDSRCCTCGSSRPARARRRSPPPRRAGQHAGQQSARRIALLHVRVDARLELVIDGLGGLHAVERSRRRPCVRLAADVERHAGQRQEIALVRGIDEAAAAKGLAALHVDRHDVGSFLRHAVLQIESFVEHDLDTGLAHQRPA